MHEVLRGTLGPVRLASLLQLVESEMLTGRLVVEGVGEVSLREGRVVAARHRDLSGMTALYELFLFNEGPWRFLLDDGVRGDALGSLLGLILEGCRLADEWERLAPLYLKGTGTGPMASDGPVATVVLRLDGRVTVADASAGLPRVRIVDALLALCEAGALAQVDPPHGGPMARRAPTPAPAQARGAALPTDYFEAMDLGRKFLRERRWPEARGAFEAALVARPNDRIAVQNLKRVGEAIQGAAPAGSPNSAFSWFRRA